MPATSNASSTRAPAGRPRSFSPPTPSGPTPSRTAAASDTRLALTAVTGSALDYLTNEVFAGYTPGLQQVLLATCQQTEVTSDDAIVMSGLPSAGDLLEQAAEDGLVVTRIRGSDTTRVLALPPAAGGAAAAAYRTLGTALAGRRPGPRASSPAPPPAW